MNQITMDQYIKAIATIKTWNHTYIDQYEPILINLDRNKTIAVIKPWSNALYGSVYMGM